VLNIAQSSLEEVRYYFILSRDLEYLPLSTDVEDIEEVARMLGAYTATVAGPGCMTGSPDMIRPVSCLLPPGSCDTSHPASCLLPPVS
jgi:hypothetical protein